MTDPKPFCTCSDVPASVTAKDAVATEPDFAEVTTEPYCPCGAGANTETTAAPDAETDKLEDADEATSPEEAAESELSSDEEVTAEEEATDETPESSGTGEHEIATLHAENGEFTLTNRRIIFNGSGTARTVLASIPLSEVSSARVDRLAKGNRSWIWIALGIAGTIGTWQLLDAGGWVRLIFPGIVAAATLILLAITLLSPPKLWFSIVSRGGDRVDDEIPRDALDDAEAFAWNVLEAARDSRDPEQKDSADPERRDDLGVEL